MRRLEDRSVGQVHPPRRPVPRHRLRRFQPLDRDAETNVEPVVGGIRLEVSHDVVAGHPAAVATRDRQAGKPGERPRRVEVQPVVVVAPGVPDVRCPVDDDGAQTVVGQGRRDGQPSGAGTDDDDIGEGGDEAASDMVPEVAGESTGPPPPGPRR